MRASALVHKRHLNGKSSLIVKIACDTREFERIEGPIVEDWRLIEGKMELAKNCLKGMRYAFE